ncbi:DUF998 domain-containing protein [Micromonospora psammae]|uniref:DUF998 domain-containing protein n=1 Tax=Micromonospora sp. CPCC 205556 TaxID=3122398 RepID=UPI002FF34184
MSLDRWGARCQLLAGPLFLAANLAAARAWHRPPYSWAVHNISDLGNVTCGRWDTGRPREVCSPWHPLFNGGAVAAGVLLALGVLLTWSALGRGPVVRAAQCATLAAAAGYVLVGVHPADVDENAHVLGAVLIFIPGNLGILVAVLARRATVLGSARRLSLVLGLAGVVGTLLFLTRVDLGFGVGGMERVAVFPLLVWQAALALLLQPGGAGPAARGG